MILHLRDSIGPESVQMLIDAYNKLEYISPDKMENLDIMFASDGGENACTSAMRHLIDLHKDITTLTAYSHIYSNGFRLFFAANCKKTILPNTRAMYHLTRNPGLIVYEGGVTHNADFDEYVRKQMSTFNYLEETDELVSFKADELEKIKSNYDLWVPSKRLDQMLKYNKKFLKL